MQPLSESLINSLRKATNSLKRDYFELEELQNSRSTENFTNRSFDRTKDLLLEELDKHGCPIFSLDNKFELPTDKNSIILIDPLEGINNFSKSLPFFASAIYYLKRKENELVITNLAMVFPSLQETYYVEKNGGMWGEKNGFNVANRKLRLRGSNFDQIETCLIGSNIPSNINIPRNHIRNFGSFYYHMALLASGKLDIVHLINLPFIYRQALSLMSTEIGLANTNITENEITTCNSSLLKKITPLLT